MLRLSEPNPPPETGYRPIDGEPHHRDLEPAVTRAHELVTERPGRAVILIEDVDDDGNLAGVDAWTVAYEPGAIRSVADGPDGGLVVDREPATVTVVHDGRAQVVDEHVDGELGVRTFDVGGLAGPHRADTETLEEAPDARA